MAEPKPRLGKMLDAEAVRPTMGKTVGKRGKCRLREILRGIRPIARHATHRRSSIYGGPFSLQ